MVLAKRLVPNGTISEQTAYLRFSGKEACFKALGTGRTAEINWHDIEVLQIGRSASCGCRVGLFRSCKNLRPPAMSLSCMSLAPSGRDRRRHRHDFSRGAAMRNRCWRSQTERENTGANFSAVMGRLT
ncbi:4'-phosphopantetheinyl transferase superfamily protein [Afipia clevelandensis]|uniref:4'-phosphopantetheinyl transferase superfamily protein n=1 Tax=Afipia clevelandensis TaxID=1034 RepID=UPI0012F6F579